jgi:putative thioredoxin
MPDPIVGAGDTAPEIIVDATEENFDAVVVARSHQLPVVVDIGADWCGPCRVIGPLLHRLATTYAGNFVLANVDADENMRIAGRHKVRGFPTVIAYSHGVEIDRFHSAQTEGFVRRFLDNVISRHAEHGQAALLNPFPDGK